MPRALRCVIIAALMVSALILGAASIHAMTSGSSSMGAMTASAHMMTPSDDMSAMHHSAPAAATDVTCDGVCGADDALVTILCVAGVMALVLLLLLLLPRPGDASRILRMIEARVGSVALARPHHTPALTQLSISRT